MKSKAVGSRSPKQIKKLMKILLMNILKEMKNYKPKEMNGNLT